MLCVLCVLCGCIPAFTGCAAGDLDRSQVPRGRIAFDEEPIDLALEIGPTFLDPSGEAPPLLGWLLAQGSWRLLEGAHVFARVEAPGVPITGGPRRVVRLEGVVRDFAYFQDYRWIPLYAGIIAALPFGSVPTALLLLFGGPIYSDRGAIDVELRLRDVQTGRILGAYRGEASSDFHHSLYTFDEFGDSFWREPEVLFGLALRRALAGLLADRRLYRRLAARS